MNTDPTPDHPSTAPVSAEPAKQPLTSRLFWFVVGGGVSYVLNAGPFVLLRTKGGFSPETAYAISLGTLTLLMFFWNYFINFRTTHRKRDCAPRYLTTVFGLMLFNYLLAQIGFRLLPQWEHYVILGVQVILAGLKFYLYNHWVFPRQSQDLGTDTSATAP
jgi:putative flippase GtrA